ncbi:phosphotransferase [Planctomonas sp. JC2975]|nr:phosphotransferase [Planctomonas sp. JC2975]
MHDGQLHVDVPMVSGLIARQFPQWAREPVCFAPGSGTVNAIFRLGDALAVRLPLVVDDPDAALGTLRREADAAREFAASTRVPAPTVVAVGEPDADYPGPWSVATWIDGDVATEASVSDSAACARDIAELILDLRSAPTGGRTFAGVGRGGDLTGQDGWMQTCFAESTGLVDVPALRAAWAALRALPRRSADAMSHTDLIPGNLLIRDGRLAGVLDVGGFQAADPALDLVVAWHLFDEPAREALRHGVRGQGVERRGVRGRARDGIRQSDDDERIEWARGAAWAFAQAMGLVWYYRESNPVMSALGRSTLERILSSDVLDTL